MRRNLGMWLVLFLVGIPPGTAAEPALPLPLDGPRRLTSSFAEYRSGHYHGGLDYSTGGEVGLPVRPPGPGHVSRIRASGVGYGRALYLALDDGRTVVLAHLSRFAPAIEAALVAEQDARGRYEVDFRPPPGSLRYSLEEPVAWTGDTGAGPPHLHAEVRRGDVALNPQTHGWQVEDHRAPTLDRIQLVPAGPNSLINGRLEPLMQPLLEGAVDTIRVGGPVYTLVRTQDRADGGSNIHATYRISALLAGVPWRAVQLDAFDWKWPGEVEWTFHEGLARQGERWMRLDRAPGARQILATESGPLLGTGPAGVRRLRVEARDVAGNATIRDVVVVVEPEPKPRSSAGAPGLRVFGDVLVLEGLAGRLAGVMAHAPDGTSVQPHAVHRAGNTVTVAWSGRSLPAGVWRVDTPTAPSNAVHAILTGDRGDTVHAGFGSTRLRVPPGAGYGREWIVVTPTAGADPGPAEPELDRVNQGVTLQPWAAPFRTRIHVGLAVPVGMSTTGLGAYVQQGDGWSYAGGTLERGVLWTRLGNRETVALFRDRFAPALAFLHPSNNASTNATPRIEVQVSDTGAGVVASGLRMRLDGEDVIAEWDPEAKRYRARLRKPLAGGQHLVRVDARDRAGNASSTTVTFYVP